MHMYDMHRKSNPQASQTLNRESNPQASQAFKGPERLSKALKGLHSPVWAKAHPYKGCLG